MSPSSEISAFPPDESPKASKFCAATGKPFAVGEKIHSILFESDGVVKRRDYSASGWKTATKPENVIAEWTTTNAESAREVGELETLAPNDALAALFDALADRPEKADLRYALALLLTRRRVFRYEYDDSHADSNADGDARQDAIYVYSSRNDVGSLVPVVPMDEAHMRRVQDELEALLNDPNAALARELARSARADLDGGLLAEAEDLANAAALAAQALENAPDAAPTPAEAGEANKAGEAGEAGDKAGDAPVSRETREN